MHRTRRRWSLYQRWERSSSPSAGTLSSTPVATNEQRRTGRCSTWSVGAREYAMAHLTKPAVLMTALLAGVCLIVAIGLAPADSPKRALPDSTVYDKDPHHLWNRIHAALHVRTGPDGKRYGGDRIEPLLWEQSRSLLQGEQATRAVAALEEFVRDNGETLIADPVKRAVLQHDLW